MAVYCSVCGGRIFEAAENCGSYRIIGSFINADGKEVKGITETCEGCGKIFNQIQDEAAQQITKAAEAIVANLKEKRKQAETAKKRQADYEAARAEFDAEYWATHGI